MVQKIKESFFTAGGQPMAGHALEASGQFADDLLGIGDDPYAYGRTPTPLPYNVDGIGYGFEPQQR